MQKYTKSLLGLLATLSLTVATGVIPSTPAAQALPQNEVVSKLQDIPVFTITNGSGGILREEAKSNGKSTYFTRVFVSFKDAQTFLQKLKKNQPTQGQSARITAASLGEIYKMQVEAKSKAENVNFVFIPAEQQVKSALGIMKKPFTNNVATYRVPLFFIAIKQNNKYFTLQRNNLTPFFFDKEQAQQWLNTVKQKDAKLVSKAEIKVNDLQGLIEDLHTRNYPEQKQVVLVPSRESQDIIRKIQATQPQPGKVTPKK
jgi:nickel transport protein